MRLLLFVGLIFVFVCYGMEPMPNQIMVDMNGIYWVGKNGTENVYHTKDAFKITGAIPWVHTVVCVRSGDQECREPHKAFPERAYFSDVFIRRCVRMECRPIPYTDKVDVIYPDIRSETVRVDLKLAGSDSCWFCLGRSEYTFEDTTKFNPQEFVLNLRAIKSLSILWHIN